MIALKEKPAEQEFLVVHPLFDKAEEKCDPGKLGRLKMSGNVKICLMLLRVYLTLMTLLLTYHLIQVSGLFGHLTK